MQKPAHKICGVYFCVWRLAWGRTLAELFVSVKELASVYAHDKRRNGSGRGAPDTAPLNTFSYATMGTLQKELLFIRGATVLLRTCPSNRESHYIVFIETQRQTNGRGETMSHASLYISLCYLLLLMVYVILGIDKRLHVSRSFERWRCFERTQWWWRLLIRK